MTSLTDSDPETIPNRLLQVEQDVAKLKEQFVFANAADELVPGLGDIYPEGSAVEQNYQGITLRNGAYTENEAAINLPDLGYVVSQVATSHGVTKQMRLGVRDNEIEPETVLQQFEPGAEINVDNNSFDRLDLTGWTQNGQGKTFAALATLSTSFVVRCMLWLNGDLYVGGESFTTSAVWKYSGGVWAAYGTLDPTKAVRALAAIGNDIYAGGTMATSKVWKSTAGGAWAAYGTLTAGTSVFSLVVIGADIYAGGDMTTSKVWKSAAGGAWAAYGTLTVGSAVYAMIVLNTDIYAAGDLTTSSVWKSAAGGAWAAYGALSGTVYAFALRGADIYAAGNLATSLVHASVNAGAWAPVGSLLPGGGYTARSIIIVGSEIYVGGDMSTSKIWRYFNGAWSAWKAFSATNVFVLNNYDNGIFAGGQGLTTSSAWGTTTTDSWDASAGYAEVTNVDGVPELEMSTRFAVTAGDRLLVTASTIGAITGGTLIMTVGVKFYTASSGGYCIAIKNAFNRVLTADGALNEMDGSVIVPTGATHATLFAVASNTPDVSATAKFIRFFVGVANSLVELILNDSGMKQKIGDDTFYFPRILDTVHSDVLLSSSAAETDLWSYSLKGGTLGSDGCVEIDAYFSYLNASGVGRLFTLRFYYDSTAITVYSNTFGSSATRVIIHVKIKIRGDASVSAQRVLSTAIRTSNSGGDGTPGGANQENTTAVNSALDKNLKITAQHAASASSIEVVLRELKAVFVPNT